MHTIFFFMGRSIAWELIMPISQYQRIEFRNCLTVSCKSARPFIKIPTEWGFSALHLLLKHTLRESYETAKDLYSYVSEFIYLH